MDIDEEDVEVREGGGDDLVFSDFDELFDEGAWVSAAAAPHWQGEDEVDAAGLTRSDREFAEILAMEALENGSSNNGSFQVQVI